MLTDGRVYLRDGTRFSLDYVCQHKSLLDKMDEVTKAGLFKNWWFMAREEQLPPDFKDDDWTVWLYLAGRGAGKTRTGAEFCRILVMNGYNRLGLIAPTASDVRDVMVDGESGIMRVCYDDDTTTEGIRCGKPLYEPSKRRLTWENGAIATLYSADEPERLRGPQHDFIWADELCSWRYTETWDLAMFGLRLGMRPLSFISTTPKPKPLLLDLLKSSNVKVSRGTTYDNRRNLPASFFKQVIAKYEGTRLGSQELEANVLEESEQALWSRDVIERQRIKDVPSGLYFKRCVVAIDPATSNTVKSDETGIIVCGIGNDDNGYILKDKSGHYSPDQWASVAISLYRQYKCDYIIAESNQGGDMVRHTLQTVDKNIAINLVRASKGKAARAEPIAALFEQGKVFFVGLYKELEDQLCRWEPLSGEGSPDRLDAMVWGLTSIMINKGITKSGKLSGFY